MTENAPYQPTSGFLIDVLNETVPLSGSECADHNLRRVIDYLADAAAVNRDWAAFILGDPDLDSPIVREALLTAATTDCSPRVRAEALRGLAQMVPALALPMPAKPGQPTWFSSMSSGRRRSLRILRYSTRCGNGPIPRTTNISINW